MRRSVFYVTVFLILIGLFIGINIKRRNANTGRRAGTESLSESVSGCVTEEAAPLTRVAKLSGEIDIRNAFIKVADDVGKAVVTISTEKTQRVGFQSPQFRFRRFGPQSPFRGEDPFQEFFEEFFGQLPEREFKQRGLGSGFIIDKQGHILTNYHVIEGADKINITLSDGRTFLAKLKGADARSDMAVIKIEAKEDFPTAKLGNSDLLQIGEWVVALGNPFGHVLRSPKPTVTVGVVSALHRRIPAPGGDQGYLDMIQTDAAINPGNSGGPLCDLNGNVIGINVVIFSTSGGHQGMGFAIPINMAKNILDDLISGKEIAYGWLGVGAQDITPEMAAYFNLPDQKGALVAQILPDSPAKKAGLQEGDVIKKFNGKEVANVHDLLKEVGNAKIGEAVRIEAVREGKTRTFNAEIVKRPSREELAEEEEYEIPKEAKAWRGIRVMDINERVARELGIKDTEGVVIAEISPMSPCYSSGLRKGDVIRSINRIRIRNVEDYVRVTAMAKGNALVRTERGYFVVSCDEEEGR